MNLDALSPETIRDLLNTSPDLGITLDNRVQITATRTFGTVKIDAVTLTRPVEPDQTFDIPITLLPALIHIFKALTP